MPLSNQNNHITYLFNTQLSYPKLDRPYAMVYQAPNKLNIKEICFRASNIQHHLVLS